MATYKQLNAATDIKTARSVLNQLVDVIQEDVSGSSTRKKYHSWVTGGNGPGVTSSMFQTVYDQDFTLQTANPCLDLTFGLFSGSATVSNASTGVDSAGKVLFKSQSLMMREKISLHKQYAGTLLGNANSQFSSPFKSTSSQDLIDEALFINIKRLFARDEIKKDSFAMRLYTTASLTDFSTAVSKKPNLSVTSELGADIITDVGSSRNIQNSFGGDVGTLVRTSNTADSVGLIFYQQGMVVLDFAKIISGSQKISGSIPSVTSQTVNGVQGRVCLGGILPGENTSAKFIPDFVVSASIDTILDHVAETRFSSGSLSFLTFQNNTKINSSLIFCRATADEFNYSSNPTYVNRSTNKIRVIENGMESTQKPFSYITTVGLYDANDNLVAVAKLSRPVEKNDEKDLTIRVRLDF